MSDRGSPADQADDKDLALAPLASNQPKARHASSSPVPASQLPNALRTSGDVGKAGWLDAKLAAGRGSPDASNALRPPTGLAGEGLIKAAVFPQLPKHEDHLGGGMPARAPRAASPLLARFGALADGSSRPASPLTVLGASRLGAGPYQQQQHISEEATSPNAAAAAGEEGSSSAATGRISPRKGGSPGPGTFPAGSSSSSTIKALQDPKHSRELLTGISPLPSTYHKRLALESPESKAPALPAPLFSIRTPADPSDAPLMVPVDPNRPGYYWQPVSQEGLEQLLSNYQVELLPDVLPNEPQASPLVRGRQRCALLMRLPMGAEHFTGAVPAVLEDPNGQPCLIVLPSDRPSTRQEASAVQQLLAQLLKEPEGAAAAACAWRAEVVSQLSTDALGVLPEVLRLRGITSWQFLPPAGISDVPAATLDDAKDLPAVSSMCSLLARSKDGVSTTVQAATAAAAATADALTVHQLVLPPAIAACLATPLVMPGDPGTPSGPKRRHSPILCSPSRGGSMAGALMPGSPQAQQQQKQPSAGSPERPISPNASEVAAGSSNRLPCTSAPPGVLLRELMIPGNNSNYPGATPMSPCAAALSPAGNLYRDCQSPKAAAAGMQRAASRVQGHSLLSQPSGKWGAVCDSPKPHGPGASSSSLDGQQQPLRPTSPLQRPVSPSGDTPGSPGPNYRASVLGGTSNAPRAPSPLQPTSRLGCRGSMPGGFEPPTAGAMDTEGRPSSAGMAGQPVSPETRWNQQQQQQPDQRFSSAGRAPSPLSGQRAPSAEGTPQQDRQQHDQQQLGRTSPKSQRQLSPRQQQQQLQQQHQYPGIGPYALPKNLSNLYSLSLGTAVCMADLIRQVEVGCAERGRALVLVWNTLQQVLAASSEELRSLNSQLQATNSSIRAQFNQALDQLKGMEFLRREVVRFRRQKEQADAELGRATSTISTQAGRLQHLEAELTAVEELTRKRLARLRWRNAVAALGTWSRQSPISSTCSSHGKTARGPAPPSQLLSKVAMLEKMAAGVVNIERRKAAWGRGRTPDFYLGWGSGMGDAANVVTQGPRVATAKPQNAWQADKAAASLTNLNPEARTMVLSTMPEDQRWKVLVAMSDQERAEVVIAASTQFRDAIQAHLDPEMWARTMELIKTHSTHAARYLHSLSMKGAAEEMGKWDIFQQVDALTTLEEHTAAAIMTHVDPDKRAEIISLMEPHLAANIMQAMQPPPAAVTVDRMEMKKALNVLLSMDPGKAADVMMEMGAPAAAQKLLAMDIDSRHSILESMAPRAAAHTLTNMEDLVQAIQAQRSQQASPRPGSMDSPVMGAMSTMSGSTAYNIMKYMDVKERAAMLAAMDPEAVAKLLVHMDPNEAAVLLSALGDGNALVVSRAMTHSARTKLVRVLDTAEATAGTPEAASALASAKSSARSRKGTYRNRPETGQVASRLEAAYDVLEEAVAGGGEGNAFGGSMGRVTDEDTLADGGDWAPEEAAAPATVRGPAANRGKATKVAKNRQPAQPKSRKPAGAGAGAAAGPAAGPGAAARSGAGAGPGAAASMEAGISGGLGDSSSDAAGAFAGNQDSWEEGAGTSSDNSDQGYDAAGGAAGEEQQEWEDDEEQQQEAEEYSLAEQLPSPSFTSGGNSTAASSQRAAPKVRVREQPAAANSSSNAKQQQAVRQPKQVKQAKPAAPKPKKAANARPAAAADANQGINRTKSSMPVMPVEDEYEDEEDLEESSYGAQDGGELSSEPSTAAPATTAAAATPARAGGAVTAGRGGAAKPTTTGARKTPPRPPVQEVSGGNMRVQASSGAVAGQASGLSQDDVEDEEDEEQEDEEAEEEEEEEEDEEEDTPAASSSTPATARRVNVGGRRVAAATAAATPTAGGAAARKQLQSRSNFGTGGRDGASGAAGGSTYYTGPSAAPTGGVGWGKPGTAAAGGGAGSPAAPAAGEKLGAAGGSGAWNPTATKQRALKDALRNQVNKKAGAAAGSSRAAEDAAADDGATDPGSSTVVLPSGTPAGGSAAPAEPQAKLGRLPKNARLIEAMAQHKNAKPKPKGWLMAVVDSIYKEGETLLRKLGRADMIKKQSVPEICFAYFHNKYGQRALVNENVGSLVNTLTLYKRTDLRLEAFARLLSEEWDVSIFIDFLTAQSLCMQPLKIVAIEYPREPSKDEQYAWVCLYKATYVADSILGARSQAARERFNEFLRGVATPADDADVEKLRRERREAAAKGAGSNEEMPEAFFKLPRIRLLLILCKEMLRINRFLQRVAEDRFRSMDLQHAGRVGINDVRSFVRQMSPGATETQVMDNFTTFVTAAEYATKDAAPDAAAVGNVSELVREGFVAGVLGTPPMRDVIKVNMLGPAPLEGEDAEAQVFATLLGVVTNRHQKAMQPALAALAAAASPDSVPGRTLQQLLSGLQGAASSNGDVRFKAYVNLLMGFITTEIQGLLESAHPEGASDQQNGAAPSSVDAIALEAQLCRLEDAVLLLVAQVPALLLEEGLEDNTLRELLSGTGSLSTARLTRLASQQRSAELCKRLITLRGARYVLQDQAAGLLQRAWLRWSGRDTV